jgi:hypothetical protein
MFTPPAIFNAWKESAERHLRWLKFRAFLQARSFFKESDSGAKIPPPKKSRKKKQKTAKQAQALTAGPFSDGTSGSLLRTYPSIHQRVAHAFPALSRPCAILFSIVGCFLYGCLLTNG